METEQYNRRRGRKIDSGLAECIWPKGIRRLLALFATSSFILLASVARSENLFVSLPFVGGYTQADGSAIEDSYTFRLGSFTLDPDTDAAGIATLLTGNNAVANLTNGANFQEFGTLAWENRDGDNNLNFNFDAAPLINRDIFLLIFDSAANNLAGASQIGVFRFYNDSQKNFRDTFESDEGEMKDYDGKGQSGSLVNPLGTYTTLGDPGQTKVSGNDALLYANGNLRSSFSLEHNFTDAKRLTFKSTFNMPQGNGWIKFGDGPNTDYRDPGGVSFIVNGQRNISLYANGAEVRSLGPLIQPTNNSLQVELKSSANYDGSGTVEINAWLNGVQLDLNGAGVVGTTYTTSAGFTQNYVTFAHDFDQSGFWSVQDWEVSAKFPAAFEDRTSAVDKDLSLTPLAESDLDSEGFFTPFFGNLRFNEPSNTTTILAEAAGGLAITSGNPPNGVEDDPFAGYTITANNGATLFSATGLPDGLSVNAATGEISGTPTESGTFNVTLKANNPFFNELSKSVSLTVAAAVGNPPVITPPTNQTLVRTASFSLDISATENPTSYTLQGAPAGLSINAQGQIRGSTTAAAGDYVLTVTAANPGGSRQETFTLTVSDPTVTPSSAVVNGVIGVAITPVTMTVSPGTTATFSASLPAGLSIDRNSGTISGTPTDLYARKEVQITADFGSAVSVSTNVEFSVVSLPPLLLPLGAAEDQLSRNQSVFLTLEVNTNNPSRGPYTFLVDGELPPGLTLDPKKGIIVGVSKILGQFPVIFRAKNDAGFSPDLPVTFTLEAPAAEITSRKVAVGGVNKPFIYKARSNDDHNWQVIGTPAWMNVSETELSGVPSAAGTYRVTLVASTTGRLGNAIEDRETLTITVTAGRPNPSAFSFASGIMRVGVPVWHSNGAEGVFLLGQDQGDNSPIYFNATGLPPGLNFGRKWVDSANVVVNEVVNSTADSIELLAIGNNLNMVGMILKDFSGNMGGDAGGSYTFNDVALWQSVKAGTLVVLTRDATATEDTDPSDGLMTVKLTNTTYFTAAGSFDVSTTDMVMIKAAGSGASGIAGAIHTFGNGPAGTLFKLANGAKLLFTAGGAGGGADNATSAIVDYNGTGVTGGTVTLGAANNANNQAYITALRDSAGPNADPLIGSWNDDDVEYKRSARRRGMITGTPLQAGTFPVTIYIQNGSGYIKKPYTLTVLP